MSILETPWHDMNRSERAYSILQEFRRRTTLQIDDPKWRQEFAAMAPGIIEHLKMRHI